MPFDPTKPANNSPLDAAAMRTQLTGLQNNITAAVSDKVTQARLSATISGTAINPINVQPMSISFSNPPTDGEMFQVQDKFNELLAAIKQP